MIPSPSAKVRSSKFGFPTIAAMICMITSLTSELTTALNAIPMITATARSSTLPRITNLRKSLSRPFILPPCVRVRWQPISSADRAARAQLGDAARVVAELGQHLVGVLAEQRRAAGEVRGRTGELRGVPRLAHAPARRMIVVLEHPDGDCMLVRDDVGR